MQSGTHQIQIPVSDRTRRAILHIPPSFNTDSPAALIAFHGAGTCAEQMVEFCGLNQTADEQGFAVVYPNGSGRTEDAGTWNGGPECGYAGRQNVDDVGFTRQLIEVLRRDWFTPATCFFPVGMSNGGLMCYRLAAEMADEFRAIVCVAGAMGSTKTDTDPSPASEPATLPPVRPVSILHLHGTNDEFVPYNGGVGRRSLTKTPFVSVPDSVAAWVRWNNCDAEPRVEPLSPTEDDGTHVVWHRYEGGLEGSRVWLGEIVGGGHTWPGRPSEMSFLGKTTANLDANASIWDFFRDHRG